MKAQPDPVILLRLSPVAGCVCESYGIHPTMNRTTPYFQRSHVLRCGRVHLSIPSFAQPRTVLSRHRRSFHRRDFFTPCYILVLVRHLDACIALPKIQSTVLYVEITICTMTSAEVAPAHASHICRLHAMIHGMRPTLVTRRVNLLPHG